MSFFEGGRKTINQTSYVTNQQAAVQGSGNFTVTGGLSVAPGAKFDVQTTDFGAVKAGADLGAAAIAASGRYAEFMAESNRLGLATVGDVAKTYAGAAERIAGTGMSPEQIAADRGTLKSNPAVPIVLGVVAVVGIIIVAKKLK